MLTQAGGAREPAWARVALVTVALLTAALMLTDVTRSGYGNTYYAAGALAASHSWSAMFDNAADLGGYVTLDKGPLPDWLMGLSGRVFGFGPFSVMAPSALYETSAVVVLYDAVRRALGRQIAIVAALMMALTPVAVLVGRYNAPDALLLLLLVCAAWSVTVAVQTGRMRALWLCAVLVGLAFNTKMLEAYVVAPALGMAFLLARRYSLRRRLGELAAATALTLFVSLLWFGPMMLTPAAERPYVGDSTDNSWFQLILEGNGIQRVTGNSGAFGREFESNLSYLFSHHIASQIAWLLPLALVGLLVGLCASWRQRRTTVAFAGYALWSAWAVVGCVVLSFSAGTRHSYYTSIVAPAVATLAAAGLVTLWRWSRGSLTAAVGLAIVVVGSAVLSFAVLADAAAFLPWLRWVVLACGAVAGVAVLAPHARGIFRGTATRALAVGGAAVALLAAPAAYSLATVARSQIGYAPTAGPVSSERTAAAARTATAVRASAQARAFAHSLVLVTAYARAHRGHARFLLAATDAKTAAPIALASGQPVITIGGFSGADPTPAVGQVVQLVDSGQLHSVLLDASRQMPTSAVRRADSAPTWVERHCSRVPSASVVASATGGAAGTRAQIVSKLTLFECAAAAARRGG